MEERRDSMTTNTKRNEMLNSFGNIFVDNSVVSISGHEQFGFNLLRYVLCSRLL